MMAQEGPNFDLSRVSTADKIILGAAGAFFLWVLFPVWYHCCSVGGVTIQVSSASGLRFPVVLSWVVSILAIVEIVAARIMVTEFKLPAPRGVVHLALAGVAVLFTILGLVIKASGWYLAWGLFLGIVISLIWAYGAYMLYSEPQPG